jgi:hypothetical protein
MKSERRHELQHNTLADWLVKSSESIKPYQNQILAGVTLLVVLVAVYVWWSRYSESRTTDSWNQFYVAMETGNLEKLSAVIDDYPGTKASDLALLVSASAHFDKGCEQLFVSKAIGEGELSKAIDGYEKILKQSKTPLVLESATLGLARAYEARGDKESLEQAEKNYEIVSKWPKGGFAAIANQRLADLKKPEIRQMYADYKPRPAGSSGSSLREPLPGLEGYDMKNLPNDAPGGLLDSSPFNKEFKDKGKAKDKAAEKDEKSSDLDKPLGSAKPLGELNPLGDTKPLEDKKPLGDTKPLEDTKPLGAAKPLEDTKPLDDTKPLEDAKPAPEKNAPEKTDK